MVIVGGPNRRPTNPRWRTAAILKKNRFWWDLVQWRILASYSGFTFKISNFWKSKIASAAILKIRKISISPERFHRSLRNLVRWCKMGFLTAPAVKKNSNITNPRWRTAAILKTVKSPYLCNRLTDFDEIWHDDVHGLFTSDRPLKISNFWKSNMSAATILKITKIAISPQGLTDLYEIWYADEKWVS